VKIVQCFKIKVNLRQTNCAKKCNTKKGPETKKVFLSWFRMRLDPVAGPVPFRMSPRPISLGRVVYTWHRARVCLHLAMRDVIGWRHAKKFIGTVPMFQVKPGILLPSFLRFSGFLSGMSPNHAILNCDLDFPYLCCLIP